MIKEEKYQNDSVTWAELGSGMHLKGGYWREICETTLGTIDFRQAGNIRQTYVH